MRFLKTFIILSFVISAAFAQDPAKLMPDFDFLDKNTEHFTKSDLKQNQKTLIVFFDATCPHCQKAGTFFNSRLKDLKPYNVLFVTMDEPKAIDMFMKDYAPLIPDDKNVKILRDTNYYFVPNFLPKRYPAIYVYDEKQDLQFYTSDEKEFYNVINVLKLR